MIPRLLLRVMLPPVLEVPQDSFNPSPGEEQLFKNNNFKLVGASLFKFAIIQSVEFDLLFVGMFVKVEILFTITLAERSLVSPHLHGTELPHFG